MFAYYFTCYCFLSSRQCAIISALVFYPNLFCLWFVFDFLVSSLRNHFYQFGEIRTITLVERQQCAFVQFATRQGAELAVEKSFNKLIINGLRLVVKWGRAQAARGPEATDGFSEMATRLQPVPGLPTGMLCVCVCYCHIGCNVNESKGLISLCNKE